MMKNIFIFTLSCFLGSLVIIFFQQKKLLFCKKENVLLQNMQFQVQESNIEKFLFFPFSISNQNQKNTSLEKDFLKKIENMRMIDIQEKVIKQYFKDDEKKQKNLVINLDTINFEEFSLKEKESLLNKIDARSKVYHFDDFELALCKYDDNYGIGITCKNDFFNPFSSLEGTDQIFTGMLIREKGERLRYSFSLPEIGSGPSSVWIDNGELFVAMHTVPEGDYWGHVDFVAAIYSFGKAPETGEYGWMFQSCYDATYSAMSSNFLGNKLEDQMTGNIFWEGALLRKFPLFPTDICFNEFK